MRRLLARELVRAQSGYRRVARPKEVTPPPEVEAAATEATRAEVATGLGSAEAGSLVRAAALAGVILTALAEALLGRAPIPRRAFPRPNRSVLQCYGTPQMD